MKQKIGVYICYCGSNISDYVDVKKVRDQISEVEGVKLAKTTMFACADSMQKEMVEDITGKELDAIVVASCSPKLHLFTFRNIAVRAGLNPYSYVQVNIREQASWAHSDNPAKATIKAFNLIKAGVERVKYSKELNSIFISSKNTALIIGAGIAGMRAAIELGDMGTEVHLIEREHFTGGRTSQWSRLFTTNETGEEVISKIFNKVYEHNNIHLLTGAEVISTEGTVGDFKAKIKITPRYIDPDCKLDENLDLRKSLNNAIKACPIEVEDEFNFNITKRKAIYKGFESEFPHCPVIDMKNCTKCGECEKLFQYIDFNQEEKIIEISAGAIIVATGFDPYEPPEGRYAYKNSDYVITLPQFKRLLEINDKEIIFKDKKIKSVAYIYCVGSRNAAEGNEYCSRYCCTSAIHAATHARNKFSGIYNIHFTRGIRTYGKQELLYNTALENKDIFLQYDLDTEPVVTPANGHLNIKINDILTEGKEIETDVDLVVLVTGMKPRKDNSIADILKIPIGRDKFFNEIHPKLKPVETLIDGVLICGACQAPFNITESVKSSLSAASKVHALISKGKIELNPTIAFINKDLCEYCNDCSDVCTYDAIEKISENGKDVANIIESKCKGCGMCLPVCEKNAIDLIGYTDKEIEAMIDAIAV
jgi:heterodisulfide reductase subunit A